ncbi:MAG: ornithine carbamoyltransferase, partial [Elusimicrobiota bacterium]
LEKLVRRALELKKGAAPQSSVKRKVLAMIFMKPSTRTNISFSVAMHRLEGQALYLGSEALQLSRGETIRDTARTISRYVDAIMIRTFSHEDLLSLAKNASVPVINGLTNLLHPCQALGDVMTICEEKGFDFKDIRVAYIGDGNNVCNSLINAAGILGFELIVSSPPGYEPSDYVVVPMKQRNYNINIESNPMRAVKEADVIYTDVWVSMGDEAQAEERKKKFVKYQLNSVLAGEAKPDYIAMHCLPAKRGEEITDEIIDGPNSRVYEQAENRLHIQQALLEYLLNQQL